jgi:hypothetical protein
MERETQLWSWLLFSGAFSPQRAKSLLMGWQAHGVSVEQVLQALPAKTAALGLTNQETLLLQHLPSALPDVEAVRWNEPTYPAGLLELPERQRPALLFTRGDRDLMLRPMIFLYPGELSAADQEMLHEAVGLLLGEAYLLSALEDTQQAEILEMELASSEGEGLVVARRGLALREMADVERALTTSGRLLLMTPLSGSTAAAPHLDAILTRIAVAAARRIIGCGAALPPTDEWPESKPILWLTQSSGWQDQTELRAQRTDTPTDILDWIAPTPYPDAAQPEAGEASETGLDRVELEPPPSTEQVLATLAKGGAIPEALRRRLAERTKTNGS